MEPKIVEKGQIILVGFSFYGDPFAESGGWTEENEIGQLWRRFEAFMIGSAGRIKHIKDPLAGYEIHIWSEETAAKGHADVFAGMEVEKLEDVPMEVLVKILPPTTYAVFTLRLRVGLRLQHSAVRSTLQGRGSVGRIGDGGLRACEEGWGCP